MEKILEESPQNAEDLNSSEDFDEIINNEEIEGVLLPQVTALIDNFAERNDQSIDDKCFRFFQSIQETKQTIPQIQTKIDVEGSIREEISKLREIRQEILDKRSEVENDREIYEFEEIIDIIDIVIESKNQYLSKNKKYNSLIPALNKRLLNLSKLFMEFSQFELELLIVKLLDKVIELRDSTKQLETQLSEMEIEKDAFNWKLQILNHALFQTQLSENVNNNKLMPSSLMQASTSTGSRNGNCNLLIQQQQHTIRQLTSSVNSSKSSGHNKRRTRVTIEKNKLIIHQNQQP